ncbi:MAG: hypothetical protein A3C10_01645 [Candidatus Magasanikbacteria bacterium RIFCSPHIGHO2_02_FULL_48_18]|nr:MAG: hypothetical protein A3I74_04675 [Candidatus Magasanikbacteria bacterium RIFCSPLOWO2_02_FULL_47_16]OGH79500.1 MAG: hypothetical protein A3C10_01645 [Candidatus Magasanikbacteria bacterium RIFCSPHIGHO2_02_FULL_48_18]
MMSLMRTIKHVSLVSAMQFGIALFLFLFPWQTIWMYREPIIGGMKFQYGVLGLYATEILLWGIIVLFCVWYVQKIRQSKIQGRFQFSWTPDRICVALFFSFWLYALMSSLRALDSALAFQQGIRIVEAFLFFFVLWAGPCSFSYIARWFALGSGIPALLGIWQFTAQSTFSSTLLGLSFHALDQAGTSIVASESLGRVLRAHGPFSHPNMFGGYLVVAMLMTVVLLSLGERAQQYRKAYWSLLFLQGVALFFTFSRTAWLAAVSFLFSFFLFSRNADTKRPPPRMSLCGLAGVVFIVLIFGVAFFPILRTRFSVSSRHESYAVSDRIVQISQAMSLVKMHPWIGVGGGNYTSSLMGIGVLLPIWQYQPVHNVFLLLLAEFGFAGVSLLALSGIFFLFSFYYQNQPRSFLGWILIPYLIVLSLDHYMFTQYSGLLLNSMLLCVYCVGQKQKNML